MILKETKSFVFTDLRKNQSYQTVCQVRLSIDHAEGRVDVFLRRHLGVEALNVISLLVGHFRFHGLLDEAPDYSSRPRYTDLK